MYWEPNATCDNLATGSAFGIALLNAVAAICLQGRRRIKQAFTEKPYCFKTENRAEANMALKASHMLSRLK